MSTKRCRVTSVIASSEILGTYIRASQSVSPRDTAKELDDIALEPNVIEFEELFWGTFLRFAGQIPYDHTAQDRLVVLLHTMSNLPLPSSDSSTAPWYSIWHIMDLKLMEDDHYLLPEEDDPATWKLEWINMNAFLARSYRSGIKDWHVAILIMERIVPAFEDAGPVTEWRLMGGAQFLWICGEKLFHLMRDGVPVSDDVRTWACNGIQGREVMSLRRWNLWKRLLQFQQRGVVTSESVRTFISRSVQKMMVYEARPNNAAAIDAIRERNVEVERRRRKALADATGLSS